MSRRFILSQLLLILAIFICIAQLTILFRQTNYTNEYTEVTEVDSKNDSLSLINLLPQVTLENLLQNNEITTQPVIQQYEESGKSPRFLTTRLFGVASNAGLGNLLFELISLLGIATELDRIPIINVNNPQIIEVLFLNVFPRYPALLERFQLRFSEQNPTIVVFNGNKCCEYDNVNRLKEISAKSLVLNGVWFQSFKYFNHMRDTIRQLVTPPLPVQLIVRQVLPTEVYRTNIICVHVRRGDFVSDGYHKPSDAAFTKTAIQHLSQKYASSTNFSVVVMGNDPTWEKILTMDLKNVFVMENTTPEMDLSFSQQFCDNVLITAPSSTFGFWLGYFAKDGATVYYRDIVEVGEQVLQEFVPSDFFPPEWVKLNFSSDSILQM